MSLFKDLIPNPRVSSAEWPWDKTRVEQRSPWRSLAIKERRKTDLAHLCYTSTFHYILGGIFFFHWDKRQPRTLESLNYCLGFSWFSTESHTSQETPEGQADLYSELITLSSDREFGPKWMKLYRASVSLWCKKAAPILWFRAQSLDASVWSLSDLPRLRIYLCWI